VSQSDQQPLRGGVMRRIAGGRSARFGGFLAVIDGFFAPNASRIHAVREEQRRRKVAVPAPGDPPDGPLDGPDAATAIPSALLGPAHVEDAEDPRETADRPRNVGQIHCVVAISRPRCGGTARQPRVNIAAHHWMQASNRVILLA
jgi:hypothetical protein